MSKDNHFTSPSVEVAADARGQDELQAQKDADLVASWVAELGRALKREKSFRGTGRSVVALYESEKEEKFQFNILYSNTETLAPALYNSTPRPVVERRFKDEDPLGKLAAQAVQRVLEFLIDPGENEYSPFDDLMASSVLEALLPGRGVTWFDYTPAWDDATAKGKVVGETVCGEEVPWERFRHGYAKKWPQVPWVSREHLLTQEEATKLFGEELAAELPYDEVTEAENDHDSTEGKDSEATKGAKLAQVFQIWDKATKQVLFIAPRYPAKPLKVADDPLKLQGFFPCPRPLQFIQKISSLTPVALYQTYKQQAEELNLITVRINKLIAMCKVRGIYDSTIQAMENVLSAGDGTMIPADNIAALVAGGMSLDKSLWLVPIEKIVSVLQQLYLGREQIKSTIYEITGIADIMRGSSNASETLGAQEIKNQWGTLRLKRSQKRVAQYVRESLRIMAEIAVKHFSEDTLSKMTGLPWPTGAQKATATAQGQEMMAMGQAVPEDVQAVATSPSWADILEVLRSDLTRSYRIDIETNSTVDAEATEDKQNITDLVNAMAQFMNGIAPLVESGTMPFEVAQQMLLTIVRRFRFGPELEDGLKSMKAPAQKPDPKAQALEAKAKADAAAGQQKMQQEQQSHALDLQGKQLDFQMKQQEAQQKTQLMQQELQIKQQELELKKQELQLKGQEMQLKAQLSQQEMQQKAALGQQQHSMQLESLRANTNATLATAASKEKAANTPKPPPQRK